MPIYPVFPQFPSLVSIIRDEWEYEDPVAETNMESGWTDARVTRSRGRFSMLRDIYTLVEPDALTLLSFLANQTRLRAIPFQYFHPLMGTEIVRLIRPKLPGKFFVEGSPNWFQITLEVEQQY